MKCTISTNSVQLSIVFDNIHQIDALLGLVNADMMSLMDTATKAPFVDDDGKRLSFSNNDMSEVTWALYLALKDARQQVK